MTRGIRGATTIYTDSEKEIQYSTEVLVMKMMEFNEVKADDICSIIITSTQDIRASFPAKYVRSLEGMTYVPVMCATEMNVPDSLDKCIRVMMHVNTDKKQRDIKHIYLNEASSLRLDLI